VKKVLALINEIQIQDSCSSDEESCTVPPITPEMVCKLAQIAPEIWMTLPLVAKKWLLNERKSQRQEDDKTENSLSLSKSTVPSYEKETRNSNMPNQYARRKKIPHVIRHHFLIKLQTSFINRSLIINKRTVRIPNVIILLLLILKLT
jgi:hypothetical protein